LTGVVVISEVKVHMASLKLRLVTPNSDGATNQIEVDSDTTCIALKTKVEEVLGIPQNEQLLFFQNGSRNAAKVSLDDENTLEAQGVEDGAAVSVKHVKEQVLRENSVLRQSISKNGGSSYYYAHANEKELPLELRYAYGGAPTKLPNAECPNETTEPQKSTKAIAKYSWADEGDFVCIYISHEDEADAIEAAKAGKNDEVDVKFLAKSVELRISTESRCYCLVLDPIENEIVPEESKHRVSEGKRVTLKLRKKRKVTWTRLVRPK